MTPRHAVAWAQPPTEPPPAPPADLGTLRRRLAGGGARELVSLDLLEDDLREAESALGAVTGYLGTVEAALRAPGASGRDLLALAGGAGAGEALDYLGSMLASVQRRLARLASRLPPAR